MNRQPPICNYEGSDYQTRFWEQGGRDYEDRVEAVALTRLLPHSGKLLLEIGAGAGRNTPRYRSFERVVLLDYSLTQMQQARERLGAVDRYIYVAADAYRLPFIEGLFDAATMIRVLHHMADAPRVLHQVRQALQPGALFILEFANKQNLKAIVRYALRRQKWSPFTPEPVEFAALNFDFHPETVRSWLHESGFSIQRQLTVSHFRIGLLKRLVPLNLLVGMDSLAQLTGDWWQLSPSVFVQARAQASVVGNPGASHTPSPGPLSTVTDAVSFFRCPSCGASPLTGQQDSLHCPSCSRCYPIREGIYDFREY